ncbi:putative peptide modification system cyclase [Stenotrophomonas sp.]|uniref:putative peptide modification system cyclase n=1 Tax=Stenotrophomonas sp. TaxID=69392 RepID=UPI002FC901D4
MNGDIGTSTQTPQLRALLFTDLCDSLILVERIGDAAAAVLFQQHDRLVLTLQQQWNGHQIDRSDGLFLLFERAIDALGFALDYQRGLKTLGEQRGIALRARAGLHVGEVLTWENSPEAIRVGAKSLEVEGLAKPMAARLMTLARPGQILMSAVAESLTRRASGELGERGARLLWKSHGRWRFKGVPTRQEVFEVGEIGFAPLRMPRANAKARRDIPLWRQPAALAAEVAVLAVMGACAWMLLRPEPAIAFAERDWVVLGQLQNLSSNVMLDDALDQAFRISLEQSRYVNVVSDDRVSALLQMMRKPSQTDPLDRADAATVAQRAGARLVLLPVVANVGGRTRFSVEVVDPGTRQTLTVKSALARDGAVLAAVDDVTRQLRDELGEGISTIKRNSQRLPDVTTSSLDALRAYALGQKRYARGDYRGALAFYQQATQIDDQFALAYVGQTRAQFASADFAGAALALDQAERRAAHLANREAIYVRNWALQIKDPGRATDGWMRMAELYPDYLPASYNAALNLFVENRFREALPLARSVSESQVDLPAVAWDQYGRILLALGQFDAADVAAGKAAATGWEGALMRQATIAAARDDHRQAADLFDRIAAGNFHADVFRTSVALDQGDTAAAVRYAERGMGRSKDRSGVDRYNFHVPLAVAYLQAGRRAQALAILREAATQPLDGLDTASSVEAIDRVVTAQAAALVAMRLGERRWTQAVPARIATLKGLPPSRLVDELNAVLAAERARAAGDPRQAQQLLAPFINDHSRVQVRVAALRAAQDANDAAETGRHVAWLRDKPGLAYAEVECSYCLQGLNILDVRSIAKAGPGPARQATARAQR